MKELVKETKQLLIGIDKTEVKDKNGWWETYTGADFGAEMLEKILEIVERSYKEGQREERESWINQKQNKHDERIKKERDKEWVKTIKKTRQTNCTPKNDIISTLNYFLHEVLVEMKQDKEL